MIRGTLPKGASIRAGEYQCTRCGLIRTFNHVRKPALCADCKSVERLMATEVAA